MDTWYEATLRIAATAKPLSEVGEEGIALYRGGSGTLERTTEGVDGGRTIEDAEGFYNAKTMAMKCGKQARIALAIPSRSTYSQVFDTPYLSTLPVVRLASFGLFKHKSR